MRKILLGTTAVAGAAMMTMGVAQAQTAPTVRVGGFMEITGAFINDDNDKNVLAAGPRTMNRSTFDFRNEFEVSFTVSGKSANGLSYGAVIELQNDNSAGASGAGTGIDSDEAYAFVSSPTLGTLRFGDEDSAASLLAVRVPTISGMGPDGNWDELLTNRAGTRNGNSYILSGINDGSDATKVVYLSPQFFGFDFGVSFAPNSGEGERVEQGATTLSQRNRQTLSNELSAALRYRGSFGNVGVQADIAEMRADAPERTDAGAATALQDVTAMSAGLAVTAFGVTVGGEYTWGKYTGASVGRTAAATGRDNSRHYVLGATYVAGAISVGAYYGSGTQDNGPGVAEREQRVWGLGAAYTLAPGLDLIASYNNLKDRNGPDSAPGTNQRDASVLYTGMRLAF
jgi:predicted porin